MSSAATHNQSSESQSASAAVCADCGAPLSGPFCSQCGEHVIDRHSLTLWHFLNHNLLHELSHVDGKIFSTFRYLIFKPGFLSEEYFAGRRQRYMNPVRLLLTCLVVLALLPTTGAMSMNIGKLHLNLLPPGPPSAPKIEDTVKTLDVFGVLARLMKREATHKILTLDEEDEKSSPEKAAMKKAEVEKAVEKFNHELKTYGTALSFSNVVLMAGFLFLLYHRRRPLFIEHLVFSLHLASFVILFSIVPGPLFSVLVMAAHGHALKVIVALVAFFLLLVEMMYLSKALLRFYHPESGHAARWWSGPTWLARLAVIAIFIANSVFITITYAAGAAIALWRV